MTKLDYKNSTVNLYEDYIVISTYNDERTLYKKDIASFLLDKKVHTNKYKDGRMTSRVKVSRTTYITKSTPIYKEKRIEKYTPIIELHSGEKIYFLTDDWRLDAEKLITYLNHWKDSNSLDEYNEKYLLEKEKEKKSLAFGNFISKLCLIWFILLILSFFINLGLFIFVFFLPAITVLSYSIYLIITA